MAELACGFVLVVGLHCRPLRTDTKRVRDATVFARPEWPAAHAASSALLEISTGYAATENSFFGMAILSSVLIPAGGAVPDRLGRREARLLPVWV